jgi:hypothetical protein
MAPKTGLNTEIRDLYRLSPEEFTASRNTLASRLGKEKRKDDAAEVKALPKPTPSAWAVNALFERQEQKMDALIAAGKAARTAQRQTVAGKGAESLREAIRLARGLADELRWDAAQILSEGGRPPSRDLVERIAANLQAIAFSPAAAEQVARGWLDRDLDPPGFEVLAGLQVAASPVVDIASRRSPPEPRREAKKAKEKAKEEDHRTAPAHRKKKVLPMPRPPVPDAREVAREKARAAEEATRQAAAEQARREKEAEVQRRRIAVAEEKVERARSEADPLREEADRLAGEAAEAKRAAERAEHAAVKAQEKADRAAERLAEAQEALRQIR